MMAENPISAGQLTKAQVLWSQYARKAGLAGDLRMARLAWAGELLKKDVASFRELTRNEAKRVIDALQRGLGSADRDRARRMGLDGRRGRRAGVDTLAGAADLGRIREALDRLGWSQHRFERWLESPSSPIRGKTEIRTQAEANRVWWGLKAILKASEARING